MGFLKDMRKLSQQAKEVSKDWDPGAQMEAATSALQSTNQMMAQQAAAAQLAVSGEPATAQVNAARDTGALVNLQPVIEIDLLVLPQGQPPYPVTVRQVVPLAQVGRLAPGAQLPVKIDPTDRDIIWVNWAAT